MNIFLTDLHICLYVVDMNSRSLVLAERFRAAGLSSSGLEFKHLSSCLMNTTQVDSACHRSEVSEMSNRGNCTSDTAVPPEK